MQVYRGMDIGTAKPTLEERARLVHHLVDIRQPDEPYHVGEFVQTAETLIDDIVARGRLPVVSGGTAFYIRSLLCGLPEAPAASADVRGLMQARLARDGIEALHRELNAVDPQSAARIAPGDRYRIVRALEIYHTAGVPRSRFKQPTSLRDDYRAVIVAIDRPREELYRRINLRVRRMFHQGLVAEVERLVADGYGATDPGLRAIGYREFFEHPHVSVEGPAAARDTAVRASIEQAIARNSRRYAKRQLTFFRQMPAVQWIAPDDRHAVAQLVPRLP